MEVGTENGSRWQKPDFGLCFEGLQLKLKRELNSGKQSPAALFGQAAGTVLALLTAAHVSKVMLTKAAKKWHDRKKENPRMKNGVLKTIIL